MVALRGDRRSSGRVCGVPVLYLDYVRSEKGVPTDRLLNRLSKPVWSQLQELGEHTGYPLTIAHYTERDIR